MKPLYKPREGVCSRGWLFMGEQGGPCDKSCQMCYYAHQKNLVFYSYETLVQHTNLFRHYYDLDACDISGGEPTIYKTATGDIVDLVRHCRNIGLSPTIITHGQNNRADWKLGHKRPLHEEIEDAGLEDWLISLHGDSPETHDKILGSSGSFDKLVGNLDNVKRPVRFNTTLQRENVGRLPVNILKDRPPTVWNPIMFNPFFAWAGEKKEEIDFQVSYETVAPSLAEAINTLEPLGWEVNVRYWPMCIAKKYGFEANVCGYHQVSFDPWEWRLAVTARMPMPVINKLGWHDCERRLAIQAMTQRDNEVCVGCSHRDICDRAPQQYQDKYGIGEFVSQDGDLVEDTLVYQNTRGK